MDNNLELGQHYLNDETILREVADLVQARDGEHVLEIGSGPGTLTTYLTKTVPQLTCVELDTTFPAPKGVTYIQGSAVALLRKEHFPVVVGNIPYHISEPLLHVILDNETRRVIFIVGKTLAKKLLGRSMLGAYVQNCYHITEVREIDAARFSPPPKVQSSLLVLERKTIERPFLEQLRHMQTSTVKNALIKIFTGEKTKREVRELLATYPQKDTPLYQLSTQEFFDLLERL